MADQRGRLWLRIFLLSFVSLFLEVMLIRWVSVEIRIFSYFRNVILVACFLGLGIGFNLKKPRPGLLSALALAALLAALVHPAAEIGGVSLRRIPEYLTFTDFHVWYSKATTSLPRLAGGFALSTLTFVLIGAIFVPFGQELGALFEAAPDRIRAYSVNLAGSLAGTWVYTAMAWFETPPWTWLLLAGLITTALLPGRRQRAAAAALLPALVLLSWEPGLGRTVFWSPYQKLTVQEMVAPGLKGERIPFTNIEINSVLYMRVLDLSPAQFDRFPATFDRRQALRRLGCADVAIDRRQAPYYPYDLPYRFAPRPRRVLIMGAGAGNDAAAALRNGAEEVDAVEIDPVIARLGRRLHPEHPFSDPRVRLFIDDARSFYKKTDRKYDLIIFALLDSHTLTSNFTNISLDSYLYTLESFSEAKDHLAPGGVIAVSFQVAKPWLGLKLYGILNRLFGQPPLTIRNHVGIFVRGTGGTLFVSGDLKGVRARLAANPDLQAAIAAGLVKPESFAGTDYTIPTDDWPYLYVQSRRIPTLHLVMLAIIGLLMLAAVRLVPPRRLGPSHFLFLGAGFMLVETHSITKAALLFGSTWVVNVVIISAILVMALAANLVAARSRARRPALWYGALFVALLLSALVPVDRLLVGGWIFRGIVAGAFYSLPLFFAGVIFARSISRVASVEAAFAANMFGAALGGMLESSSYLLGLRAVVFIAIGLYAASAFFLRRMPERPA